MANENFSFTHVKCRTARLRHGQGWEHLFILPALTYVKEVFEDEVSMRSC